MARRPAPSWLVVLALVTLAWAGCLEGRDGPPVLVAGTAEIRWTDHGIPHVLASDWKGLGYGYGYAFARDGVCVLAEEFVTVNGERSKYFGESGGKQRGAQGPLLTNLQSDFFFNLYNQHPDLISSSGETDNPKLQDLLQGYVDGYNRYLQDTPPDKRPEPCRNAEWVRHITTEDVARRVNKLQLFASSYQFAVMMFDAQPPAPSLPVAPPVPPEAWDLSRLPDSSHMGLGSNGYAIGGGMTADGRGMLLGNPHFPWQGPERFHELHLTIPGEVDVMGMTIYGVPLVLIGFNEHTAWTHTVSTAWRFSVYEERLAPGNPTSYLYDGSPRAMVPRAVTVESRDAEGNPVTRTHTYYFTHHGPVINLDLAPQVTGAQGLAWDAARAYTVRDANAHNDRIAEQFFRFDTARSFDEFRGALREVLGIPWVNTIAASADGRAFIADHSVVPNVSNAQIEACNTPVGEVLFRQARIPVLDGSSSSCEWRASNAPQDGIMAAESLPSLERLDYLINSNDSHWLPNPRSPQEGYSAMVGWERTERTGRTRMGYVLLEERLAGEADCTRDPDVDCSKLTLGRLQDTLFSSRLFYPERVRDALVEEACRGPTAVVAPSGRMVDIGSACRTLAAWDLRANLESRGTALFELFWQAAPRTWAVPFDPDDPVHTPRDYVGDSPAVRDALANAVARLADAGLAVDVPTADARFVTRNGDRIPVHGAHDAVGSPSMMIIPFADGRGFEEVVHGNSYIQTVTWDDEGPVAEAILTYSQSTDPASPYYADQTRMFSQKEWVPLPFRYEDVQERTIERLILS